MTDPRGADEKRQKSTKADLAVWTPDDTSERGPSLDYRLADVFVETYALGDEKAVRLHLVTNSEGLWTVAIDLNRADAVNLCTEIIQSIGASLIVND